MLNLMYITNNPEIAKIAEDAGVDTIMVDMEYIGKDKRQGNLHTVQNFHTVDDVKNIHSNISKANLLVRVNPFYEGTKNEVDSVIDAGADFIMLPWFSTCEECKKFISCVQRRAKTVLLLENKDAVYNLDETLQLDGIDWIHIGLNDLSLTYGTKFMFQLLADGTVERISNQIKAKNIPFGIGGIAQIRKGALPAELIIKEHYRLGSCAAILSRSFCDVTKIGSITKIKDIFTNGIAKIRELEVECQSASKEYFEDNKKVLDDKIRSVVEGIN